MVQFKWLFSCGGLLQSTKMNNFYYGTNSEIAKKKSSVPYISSRHVTQKPADFFLYSLMCSHVYRPGPIGVSYIPETCTSKDLWNATGATIGVTKTNDFCFSSGCNAHIRWIRHNGWSTSILVTQIIQSNNTTAGYYDTVFRCCWAGKSKSKCMKGGA